MDYSGSVSRGTRKGAACEMPHTHDTPPHIRDTPCQVTRIVSFDTPHTGTNAITCIAWPLESSKLRSHVGRRTAPRASHSLHCPTLVAGVTEVTGECAVAS